MSACYPQHRQVPGLGGARACNGLATLFLTIGGLRYLMAGGDPSEVERAKTALRSAAIDYGLAILAPSSSPS
jgi:Type IV secretion system pilin